MLREICDKNTQCWWNRHAGGSPAAWLKGQGRGRGHGRIRHAASAPTHERTRRASVFPWQQGGRTQDIQALNRAFACVVSPLQALGEGQIPVDCDVNLRRWRQHPHRRDHRRLGGASPRLPRLMKTRDMLAWRQSCARSYRRDNRAACKRRRGSRTSNYAEDSEADKPTANFVMTAPSAWS